MAALATEPISGNSLTKYERSVSNLLGTSGAATQQTGAEAVSPALDYWKGILSGKPADVAASLQPELQASSEQFESGRRVLDQYAPMGGGRAQSLAASRTKEAQTKAGIISTARKGAAESLATTGTAEQSLGIQQLGQAIQAILSKMGLDIQGGTSQTFSQIVGALGSLI